MLTNPITESASSCLFLQYEAGCWRPAFDASSCVVKGMATLKQITANQINALKSTGPKSPVGKFIASRTVQELERSEFMRLLDNSSAVDRRVSGGNRWCPYLE